MVADLRRAVRAMYTDGSRAVKEVGSALGEERRRLGSWMARDFTHRLTQRWTWHVHTTIHPGRL